MNSKLEWWGYIHENGTLQVKRYFDERDLDDARESPFVREVLHPVEAEDRDEAIKKLKEQL